MADEKNPPEGTEEIPPLGEEPKAPDAEEPAAQEGVHEEEAPVGDEKPVESEDATPAAEGGAPEEPVEEVDILGTGIKEEEHVPFDAPLPGETGIEESAEEVSAEQGAASEETAEEHVEEVSAPEVSEDLEASTPDIGEGPVMPETSAPEVHEDEETPVAPEATDTPSEPSPIMPDAEETHEEEEVSEPTEEEKPSFMSEGGFTAEEEEYESAPETPDAEGPEIAPEPAEPAPETPGEPEDAAPETPTEESWKGPFEEEAHEEEHHEEVEEHGFTEEAPEVEVESPEEHEGEEVPAQEEAEEVVESESPSGKGEEGEEEPFSKVAATAKSKKAMAVGLVAAVLFLIYFAFFSGEPSQEDLDSKREEKIKARKEELIKSAKPITSVSEAPTTGQAPVLPAPPPIQEPAPPEPPPPPVPLAPEAPGFPGAAPGEPSAGGFPSFTGGPSQEGVGLVQRGLQSDEQQLAKQKALDARRKASIMVLGGGGGAGGLTGDEKGKDGEKKEAEKKSSGGEFLGFGAGTLDEGTIARTAAEQVRATKVGRLDRMIAQGKIIYAVLETAIDTNLPGTLRGIITRDVYAESGKGILIPKGSRVIGSYETDVAAGQTRVNVIWSRLIRPDGIDIQIDSGGADALGRAGVVGELHDRFWAKIGSAFLISYVIPMVANQIANINDKSISTTSTTGTDGTTTTTSTGDVGSTQLRDSADKFAEVAEQAINNSFNVKPTITVPQGTRITIFVNKDLVFPSRAAINQLRAIQ